MAKETVNRRVEIISAAIEVFAETGYYRATTAQVAERAAISQPYIFKFFSSKESLLLAALEVSWERIIHSFQQVIESAAPEWLEYELIQAYDHILTSYQNETRLQMQAQTISEEVIRACMQHGFREVNRIVLQAFRDAGMENPEERTYVFLAKGMLCNIALVLHLPELLGKK